MVVPEGMLFLGHVVPLGVVRSGNGVRGHFIRWTALLGASAGSGATPTPGYTAKGVACTTGTADTDQRRTVTAVRPTSHRPTGECRGPEDPADSSFTRQPSGVSRFLGQTEPSRPPDRNRSPPGSGGPPIRPPHHHPAGSRAIRWRLVTGRRVSLCAPSWLCDRPRRVGGGLATNVSSLKA